MHLLIFSLDRPQGRFSLVVEMSVYVFCMFVCCPLTMKFILSPLIGHDPGQALIGQSTTQWFWNQFKVKTVFKPWLGVLYNEGCPVKLVILDTSHSHY